MLIVGAPGSGKGTQAARVSEQLGIPAISTGDIFRDNVKNLTPLGQEAKAYMDNGDFVPDAITNEMVRARLLADDVESGFLLDGYPRTKAQVSYLDGILSPMGQQIDAALLLVVPDHELIARLLSRAAESGRTDDTATVIKHRLDLYHQQTKLMLSEYAERTRLVEVDGTGTIDEVTLRVLEGIETARSGLPLRA
ncbi:adenylate kinase [Arthrobacter sp. NyZ413]|uniref:adenylate kinase n=1 Tax=Arthrobacter sp. NyZ413 TaxID=3144669 RepID=UPI003BF7A6A4